MPDHLRVIDLTLAASKTNKEEMLKDFRMTCYPIQDCGLSTACALLSRLTKESEKTEAFADRFEDVKYRPRRPTLC